MSLPKVKTNAVQEIKNASTTISGLLDYKKKNWAIGLNGDTFQPDGFLQFFNDRELPFKYYLVSQGVSIGNQSAYDANVTTITQYVGTIRQSEMDACQKVIGDLQSYKSKFWAIGLNGDTLQPDDFNNFFAERGLTFLPFVRSTHGVHIGQESAYDANITTLKNYMSTLNQN